MVETLYPAMLVGGALVLLAAFSSLIAFRFGAPLLLFFLGIGLLAGEDGLGIYYDDAETTYFIGSAALAIILFDSGFGTSLKSFRRAAAPALTLATLGVLVTATIVGAAASAVLDVSFLEGLLLGAIVASTDAAAVFFLLRIGGILIRPRVRSALEIESGTNDPIAIFLTATLVTLVAGRAAGESLSLGLAFGFVQEMGLGIAFGLVGGWAIVWLIRRVALEPGLVPIFVIALGLFVFGVTGMLHGSGFLAVYVAGLYAGNARLAARAALQRFQEGMTWLAQIVMFLFLGLLATPSEFPGQALEALLLALVLIFVARPVAVWLCLLPFDFARREEAFIAWVGLRGAVSILLAILPIVGDLAVGQLFFNTAFIIVIVSLLVQGWSIAAVARRLGLVIPPRIGPVKKVELELPGTADHELLVYRVVGDSPVARGERLPRWAWPSLVLRDGRSMRYQFAGGLREGDLVFLFVPPRYPRLLDRLFASPLPVTEDDSDFFGDFAIAPETSLSDLARSYPVPETEIGDRTVADFLIERLGGRAEIGDRVPLGAIDLIVRDVDEAGAISAVGLSLDPEATRPLDVPIFANLRDLKSLVRAWREGSAEAAPAPSAEAAALTHGPDGAITAPTPDGADTPPMTPFRTLDDAGELAGERALVRVDLNVPVEAGRVADRTRIERVAPTIRELAERGAKVLLIAHFERPKGRRVPEMSLAPIAGDVAEVVGRPVEFVEDCVGEAAEAAAARVADGGILLLENTRFHPGEEANDPDFARALAKLGTIYVNDAFSAAHRAHASTEGLAHLLPAFAGRAMEAELAALTKVLTNPEKPLLAIVGGAKVSTKIELLENLVGRVDALVVGGGMANTFLAAKGVEVGRSLQERDLHETALRIVERAGETGCAIVLPADAVVATEFRAGAPHETVTLDRVPRDAMILDAGPRTVAIVNAWIDEARTLVWNGPLGAFEIPPFDRATVACARHAAARTKAGLLLSVAGGGDTVAALNQAGVAEDFSYVSTAGGAFLEWLEGKSLPGVEALRRR